MIFVQIVCVFVDFYLKQSTSVACVAFFFHRLSMCGACVSCKCCWKALYWHIYCVKSHESQFLPFHLCLNSVNAHPSSRNRSAGLLTVDDHSVQTAVWCSAMLPEPWSCSMAFTDCSAVLTLTAIDKNFLRSWGQRDGARSNSTAVLLRRLYIQPCSNCGSPYHAGTLPT